ncbi:hypothetical protein E2C01_018265 [Portunus trituberculatus]|uniref:Uncharacterized protein n=1 Tax=Portunus trituberculatus TaxID=210409 RepID=A0A5B7DU25_PORTR|nr:hypothetical protein [Portunus trituberculatus]
MYWLGQMKRGSPPSLDGTACSQTPGVFQCKSRQFPAAAPFAGTHPFAVCLLLKRQTCMEMDCYHMDTDEDEDDARASQTLGRVQPPPPPPACQRPQSVSPPTSHTGTSPQPLLQRSRQDQRCLPNVQCHPRCLATRGAAGQCVVNTRSTSVLPQHENHGWQAGGNVLLVLCRCLFPACVARRPPCSSASPVMAAAAGCCREAGGQTRRPGQSACAARRSNKAA